MNILLYTQINENTPEHNTILLNLYEKKSTELINAECVHLVLLRVCVCVYILKERGIVCIQKIIYGGDNTQADWYRPIHALPYVCIPFMEHC